MLDRVDEPMTLKEVGNVLGLSREHVRQIEIAALAKLRHGLKRMGITEAPAARTEPTDYGTDDLEYSHTTEPEEDRLMALAWRAYRGRTGR